MKISMMYTILTCIVLVYVFGFIILLFLSPTVGQYIMLPSVIALFIVGMAPIVKPSLLFIHWTINAPNRS